METLELFHPATKERINFQALSYQELLYLEIVAQDHKCASDLKIKIIEAEGREVPRPMADFSKYCGLIILMCQKHRSFRAHESAHIQLRISEQLLAEFVTDKHLQAHLARRRQELTDLLTPTRESHIIGE